MIGRQLCSVWKLTSSGAFKFGETNNNLKREKEAILARKIKEALNPNFVKVEDITIGSSSCGQMYNIFVDSDMFVGVPKVKQHQMVTTSISEDLKNIHGYNLKTKAPQKKQSTPQENPQGQKKE